MANLNFHFIHLFIFYLLSLLILIQSDILNNPLLMPFSSNPFVYNTADEIQFYLGSEKYVQDPTSRDISSPESFCPLSEINTLILNEEDNKYYIYTSSSQYLISLSDNNCQSKDISNIQLPQDNKYIGSIFEGEFSPEIFYTISSQPKIKLRCKQLANEIILYGKIENDIIFYFVEQQNSIVLGINCEIEDYFSCRKIDNSVYICIYICINKIHVDFFSYVTPLASGGNCEIQIISSNTINSGNSFSNLMVVNKKEENEEELLICAKDITNYKIKCFSANYYYNEYEIGNNNENGGGNGDGIDYGNGEDNGLGNDGGGNENVEQNNNIINSFNITFKYIQNPILSLDLQRSNNNQYCALENSVIDEFLLCCGDENIIKCSRIDNNLTPIKYFDLSIEGRNTYLNIISSSVYIHLIYMNNLNSGNKIYEYSIYIPKCPDKTYSLIPLGTITDNVNNLFIRQTNTKYYIKFISFPSEYVDFKYNNELLGKNLTNFEPLLIDYNYPLEFISLTSESINDLEFNYQIILEETFTSNCLATINIVSCYKSCKLCTKSNSESDVNNHNCVAGKCNDNYYQAPDRETNCWDSYDKKSNWYIDYENNKLGYCNEECPTCNGPTNGDCLSCRTDTELKYLYDKRCYSECPDGYYPKLQASGYYLCNECYSTCVTCSNEGSINNMGCISCKPNSIKFQDNCFQIADPILKTFILPWNNEISNCHLKYGIYIKEDSDTCITFIPEGYYISNQQTGVISPCHPDCKTCERKYTETNSKCTICKDENLNYFDGNCVQECDEGYYSKPKSQTNSQKQCIKCYENCKKCEKGFELSSGNKLINMNCQECKIDENNLNKFIKVNGNCFEFVDYEEDKINFDISLITDSTNKIKTCLDYGLTIIYGEYECKAKPSNSYYIKNDEGNNGIVKYCDISCATCNEGKNNLSGNTNCLTCSNGYYKTEDSNTNCILESLIPDDYYKFSEDNIYYKCYNVCSKCVRILNYKTNQEKMGCASCKADYYLEDGTTNCYDISFLQTHTNYYLSIEQKKFIKCYYSCGKCSQGYLDELTHNCDECKTNYYFEDGTKNCYDSSITENGYYLDDFTIDVDAGEKPVFKKCFSNCKTCSNYLIEDNMNCIKCSNGFFILSGTNNCINDITNKGYYLKNNIAYPCEDNCLTCSNGKTRITNNNLNNDLEIITEISYNCLSCDNENKNLFLVENLKNCENEDFKNMGFYLEDSTKIFKKCHKTCSLCFKGLEFDPVTNEEIHNCEKCAKNYYRLVDDPHQNNCYGDEMIEKGYLLVRNFWQICHGNCEQCSQGPILDPINGINHNCISCYTGYNFVYQTQNCENETLIEKGYYLDDNDQFYKKCHISCRTCDKYSNSDNPRCKTCNNDGGYYFAEKKPNTFCYNRTMIDKEYVLSERIDEEGKNYKIWGFCYDTCITCLKYGNEEEHGCTTCIPQYYLIYGSSNCVSNNYAVNNGYYFNNTFLKFVECDKSCINCHGAPNEETTNCKKCNNDEGYYTVEGKKNTLCRSETTIEEGYFLNQFNKPYKWSECYENCATCEYKGVESKMNCLSCRTNLLNNLNKTKYFILLEGNCIESCENNLFLTKDGDCVTECPLGTFEYILNYNYSCLESCPNKYKISSDKKRCELDLFPQNITLEEFKYIISNEMNSNANLSKIFYFNNFKARIYSSSYSNQNSFNSQKIYGINNLEEILNKIRAANNLENDEEIIIAQIEYETSFKTGKNIEIDKEKNNLGNNIELLLYDSFGNKLKIQNYISDKISLVKYVGNLNFINFNESKWFYEKGINVFDESDPFFNDICYPFKTKDGSDVSLKDRRNKFFQDFNFCGDNCQFNTIDYELMNVICLCDSSILNKEINFEKGIILDNEIFKKDLYKSNIIVIKCIKLAFDSNIIKTNLGFITNIIFLSSEIIFFAIFLINGLKPIKNFIRIFEPYTNAAPPKLTTLLSMTETKKTKEEEIQKSKLINHLLNAKRRKKNPEKIHIDDALVVDYQNNENEDNNDNGINNEKIFSKYNNNEKNKSESEESNSKKNNEKKTILKHSQSNKKILKERNIRVYQNIKNNVEKMNKKDDIKDVKNQIHQLDYELDNHTVNKDLLKRNINLGNIHISNYQYLNKNTEEFDLKSNKDKKENNKEVEKKKIKKIKKFKNVGKNNNLYTRQEFLIMNYEEAIKNDKIKFSEVYLSYLIENNFILNTIISDSFINLIPIKISYLSFRLEIIFALNALFYSDKYITQVFENAGKFVFLNSLPKSIYSLLLTILTSIGLKMLLNNKKRILLLIKSKEKIIYNTEIDNILKIIKTKLIIYFSLQFSFTLFFLYYCSAFCAVYQNSQIYWIYSCLETILFDIIFSCLFCLLITSCRLISIKKRIKCLYDVTKIINYL